MSERSRREAIQIEALEAWTNKGTIVLSTGFGKTKVAVMAIEKEQLLNNNILVVVPQVPLIGQWVEELTKWSEFGTKNVEIICLQTAYKLNKQVNLLVVDECHRSLSPKYRSVYSNIEYDRLLTLTATKPHNKEYLKFLEENSPIVYERGVEDGIEVGATAPYIMYNLEVGMDRSSRAKYNTFDGMLKRAQLEIGLIKRQDPELRAQSVFDIAQKYSKINAGSLSKWSKSFWSAMTMRKWTCYNNEAKVNVVLGIVNKFPERKWILFNKSIKFAELIKSKLSDSAVYHSGLSATDREKILDDFKNNKVKRLVAVDALNEGLNVPDADAAICVSGVSTELTQFQTLGRITRKAEDKVALFINLYSKGTVEETWVRKKTNNLKNILWVDQINIIRER